MRLIKPLRLSITQRVITYRRKHRLCVGVLTYFPLSAPEVLLPEMQLWQQTAEHLGTSLLDECRPKPRGEVLVYGSAYAPGGEPTSAFPVTLSALRGEEELLERRLAVVGDRRWLPSGAPSDPEPLTTLELNWQHAYGGEKDERNPVGKGAQPIEVDGVTIHPLPNIEDPEHLIQSKRSKPKPVCFAALPPELGSRMALMGTYDQKWLESDFPGLARDLDPAYFQVAQPGQRLDGYFDGDESFVLENLHPTKSRLEGRVPRIRCRLFAKRENDESLVEVPTRLETIVMLPNIERAVGIYRGNVDVSRSDAADVEVLLLAADATDAIRPQSHFVEVWRRRVDPDEGHLYMMREGDLLPPRSDDAPSMPDDNLGDLEELLAQEGAMLKRAKEFGRVQLEATRLQLRVLGMDPDEHGVPIEPVIEEAPGLEELPEFVEKMDARIAKIQEDSQRQKQEVEEHARQLMAVLGKDYDEEVERQRQDGAGPPQFRAASTLTMLGQLADVGQLDDLRAQVDDPRFRERLAQVEDVVFTAYRKFAHMMPGAAPRDGEAGRMLRVRVEAMLEHGESLSALDLTGTDLSGMSFAGADMQGAFFEGANLSECDLSNADLSEAVLARAVLHGVKLSGAKLVEANLGACQGAGLDLAGADLTGAVLQHACLEGARFAGATLARADVLWASAANADFSEVDAPEVLFFEQDLTGATFSDAKLRKAVFLKCKLEGARFDGADLREVTFVDCQADRVSFVRAQCQELKFVGETSLTDVDFTGAELDRANLRGMGLAGAQLEGCTATGADFSQAVLRGANLRKLWAPTSRFMDADLTEADLRGANLMDALMMSSTLAGARFEEANLFRANLLDAKGDDLTRFTDGHLERTLYRSES